MDQRGGCCTAGYGGGGEYEYEYGVSKMEMIMQRYRPIAPKPTPSGGSSSTPPTSDSRGSKKTGRGRKRGSVAKEKNSPCKKKLSATSSRSGVHDKKTTAVVTLPLLPETPDLKGGRAEKSAPPPVWLSFDQGVSKGGKGVTVTVERVLGTWVEEDVLGGPSTTDEEKVRRLEEDTCPGFISDAWNRVMWANRAFREMGGGEAAAVRVVMKEPVTSEASYTCRVKVQSTWKSSPSSAVTLPCDVWRMRSGGLAWRLDVNAALSLGRR